MTVSYFGESSGILGERKSYLLGEKWYSGGEEVVFCKGERYVGEQMSHFGE